MVTTRIPLSNGPSTALAELRRWLATTNTTRPQLAEMVGKARQWAYQVIDGDVVPGLDAAQKIEQLTAGAVRVSDWRIDFDGDITMIEVPAAPIGRPPRSEGEGERQRAVAQHVRVARLRRRTRSP